jgi:hypothetical protein
VFLLLLLLLMPSNLPNSPASTAVVFLHKEDPSVVEYFADMAKYVVSLGLPRGGVTVVIVSPVANPVFASCLLCG